MKHTLRAGSLFLALVVLSFHCSLAAGQKKTTARESDEALAVAFSPNGRLLAAAGSGKAIRIWDARTGNLLHSLEGPKRTYRRSIAFTPDGKTLIGCGDDGVVHLWNAQTGTLDRSIAGPEGVSVMSSSAISPDGKNLAVVYYKIQDQGRRSTSELRLLEFETGKIQWSHKGASCVAFAPDGKTLAVADGTVHLLNATTGTPMKDLRIEDRVALQVAFSPDGKSLAGGGGHYVKVAGGTKHISEAYLWDVQTGKLLHKLTDLRPWLRSVAFSPDGKILATGTSGPIVAGRRLSSEIRLWDVRTGRLLRTIQGELAQVWSLAFSPDGKSLLSCDNALVALTETLTGMRRLTLTKGTSISSEAPVDLKRCWTDLGSIDGEEAYRAMGQLATVSQESVPFLNGQLRPVESVSTRKVLQLIGSLDSDQFAERDNAQRELEKLHELAEEELRKALERKPSPEARSRIDHLLGKLDELKNPVQLRALRAIEVLENIGTSEAKRVLQRLAEGAPEAQQTREARASLERLGKRTKPASLP
jgi:Tol biopolymer transport system component